eukprot:UN01646
MAALGLRMRLINMVRSRLIRPAQLTQLKLVLPKFQSGVQMASFIACTGIMTATFGIGTKPKSKLNSNWSAACQSHSYSNDDFKLAESINIAKQKISAHFMLDLFRRMYKSGGDITLDFMRQVFETVGIEDDRIAPHLFAIMDRNHDGILQHNEIMVVFSLFSCGSDTQRFKFLFRCLDLDGNGTVDKHEFRATLSALLEAQYHLSGLHDLFEKDELFANISPNEYHTVAKYKANGIVRDIFIVADTNRDEQLSLKEFLHWCRTGSKYVKLLENALKCGIAAI